MHCAQRPSVCYRHLTNIAESQKLSSVDHNSFERTGDRKTNFRLNICIYDLYSTKPANYFSNIGPVNGEIIGPTKIDKKININQMQGKAKEIRQKLVSSFT